MFRRALAVVALGAGVGICAAQLPRTETDLVREPTIDYFYRPPTDPVARLKQRLDSGAATLAFDAANGYLRSMMDALRLEPDTQVLVYSKTSVQSARINPKNPRAIYFNDAVTIGYIRGAPLLEFAVQDPEQGILFYTIDQKPQTRVAIDRPSSCLRCHQVYSTLHVPGMIARSQFVAPDGLPLGQYGSYDEDDRTPFPRRWGGWYVTGTHGAMRHRGNAIVTDREHPEASISEATLNQTTVDGRFDARAYPSAHSDIVALMVFQHQMHMMNLITRVGWEARVTGGVPSAAVDELVDYALFANESPLTAPVRGTTKFAERFEAQGPFDSQHRSLRQLDLERRLLKYGCSYMIYSAAFTSLPADTKQAAYSRVLTRLAARPDGAAVIRTLRETIADLPTDSVR